MHKDVRGLEVTAAGADAVAHLDAAIASYLGLRADTGDHLKKALVADPQFPLALCTRGYFMLLFAIRGLVAKARDSLAAAEKSAGDGITPRERSHIAALKAWCDGDIGTALRIWEELLTTHPRDVLALRLAHFWHFYVGDAGKLRDSIGRVRSSWDENVPGSGFVLGMQAFGLEESGDYDDAERAGRRAIELNPEDIWGAHAVTHVLEMQDRTDEGVAWIDSLAANYSACNNFRFHLWWHRALFLLERGELERVLELYDREIRAESTNDYLDISNATSLLWRLEEAGLDVGTRWAELAKHAGERIGNHMLVFADAHYALALAAGRDEAGAQRFLESARGYAARGGETEAAIMAETGAALCEAVLACRNCEFGHAVEKLRPIRDKLWQIGGSHAQRDLFDKMLIVSAMADRQNAFARQLLSERLQRRPRNRWGLAALSRLPAA